MADVLPFNQDLEIASDFFEYFSAAGQLMQVEFPQKAKNSCHKRQSRLLTLTAALFHPPVQRDPTIMCASAWNDNGQETFVRDEKVIMSEHVCGGVPSAPVHFLENHAIIFPQAIFRTDFFPGLGWMLSTFQLGSKAVSLYAYPNACHTQAGRSGKNWAHPGLMREWRTFRPSARPMTCLLTRLAVHTTPVSRYWDEFLRHPIYRKDR